MPNNQYSSTSTLTVDGNKKTPRIENSALKFSVPPEFNSHIVLKRNDKFFGIEEGLVVSEMMVAILDSALDGSFAQKFQQACLATTDQARLERLNKLEKFGVLDDDFLNKFDFKSSRFLFLGSRQTVSASFKKDVRRSLPDVHFEPGDLQVLLDTFTPGARSDITLSSEPYVLLRDVWLANEYTESLAMSKVHKCNPDTTAVMM